MFDKLRENSKVIIIIVAVAFALSGAVMGFSSIFQSQPQRPDPQEVEELQAQREIYDEPIALVNGEVISRGEYNNRIQQQISELGRLPGSQEYFYRYQVLMDLVHQELVIQESRNLGLEEDISEEDFAEYFDSLLQNLNMSEDELSQILEMQGFSMEQYKEELKDDLLFQEGMDYIYGNIEVTEEEVKEEFQRFYPEGDLEGEEFAENSEYIEANLREQKKQQEEQQWLESLREKAEIDIKDQTLRAVMSLQQERYEEAIIDLEGALEETAIPSPGLYILLAEAFNLQGDFEQALDIYNEAIREFEGDWDLVFNLGNLYLQNDDQDQAREYFSRTAEIIDEDDFLPDEQLYLAHQQLFTVYNTLEEEELANEHLNRAQEIYQNIIARGQSQQQVPGESDEDILDDESEEIIDIEVDEDELDLELDDDRVVPEVVE